MTDPRLRVKARSPLFFDVILTRNSTNIVAKTLCVSGIPI